MRKILIIGGTSVRQNYDGSIKIKYPFKLYLEDLSNYFNEVIWLTSNKIEAPVNAKIDKKNIKIIPYNQSFFSCLKTSIFLINFFLKNKSYLLLFPSPKLHLIIPFISKYCIRSVYYLGVNPDNFKTSKFSKYLGWKFCLKFLHIFPMKYVDNVIARGDYLKKVAKVHNNNVNKTIPIGYQFTNFENKIKRNPNKVIYIGKLLEEKGVFDLYEAVKQIYLKYNKDIKLELVGDGNSYLKLKKLANEEKSFFVNFHGWINDPSRMNDFLKSSSLLICPSKSSYPEGVPRVIDEALACETPVLCSDQTTFTEEFKNGEIFFFKSGDISDLSQNILFFLDNKSFRTQLNRRILSYNASNNLITAAKQHASIILNDKNIKTVISGKTMNNKIILNRFEKSLSSHRNLNYLKNRVFEIIYRFFNKEKPWLTPKANVLLNKMINKNHIGFEFGSGKSTIWLARRLKSLISIETNKTWHSIVTKLLNKNKIKNVDLTYVDKKLNKFEENYLKKLNEYKDNSFDFILIDAHIRDVCAHSSVYKLKPGGVLVIDNINRYLPFTSQSPYSITNNQLPISPLWEKINNDFLVNWQCFHTTNGVTDTAIYIKP